MNTNYVKLALPAAALLLAAAACGTAQPQDVTPTTTTAAAATVCVDATAFGTEIAKQAKSGTGMQPGTAMAVKMPDRANVYLIAMQFTVTGVKEPQVGIWASSSIVPGDATGLYSVDAFAKNFTNWLVAADTKVDIKSTDPAITDAKDCLSK